jgi:pyridoxal phosphate enzyme (YggS family)
MAYADLPARLGQVRETIARHRALAGWGHEVRIVGVTKTHPAEAVRAAVAAGLADVGENRVQEALAKQDEVGGMPVRWHLIGSLQRNKARHAAGRFDLIHTVDRLDIGQELSRRLAAGQRQAVLVQVNCSAEPQKGGVDPADLPQLLEGLGMLPGLEVRGLMTMAAFDADDGALRATFRLLRRLRDEGEDRGWVLPELSMGMSGDFPIAVEEGATMVRLGTVLFGERQ